MTVPTMARCVRASVMLCVSVLAMHAFAGNHVRSGGTLQVALVSPAPAVEPLTANAPVDAVRLLLTHQLLCRVAEFSRPAPTSARLSLPPSVEPRLVTDALSRVSTSASPARGLTSAIASWSVNGRSVELVLKQPVPDLDKMFCHPAFAIPLGAFRTQGSKLLAFEEQPLGRPYVDAVVLQASDARTVERWLSQRRVQLAAGTATSEDVPQLFVTALHLGPGLGALKQAIESSIDRADLARFFVTSPSGPLTTLLPAIPATGLATKPPVLVTPKELTLLFDEAAPHERNIAQRLQIKLQPLGYRLALKPLPVSQLQTPSESELVVRSLALPPTATGALLMWLELTGQRARIPAVLQQLAAATDLDAKVKELNAQLLTELPLVPLVTRGLGVSASKDVQHLTRDVLGLPRLDDVSLAE